MTKPLIKVYSDTISPPNFLMDSLTLETSESSADSFKVTMYCDMLIVDVVGVACGGAAATEAGVKYELADTVYNK